MFALSSAHAHTSPIPSAHLAVSLLLSGGCDVPFLFEGAVTRRLYFTSPPDAQASPSLAGTIFHPKQRTELPMPCCLADWLAGWLIRNKTTESTQKRDVCIPVRRGRKEKWSLNVFPPPLCSSCAARWASIKCFYITNSDSEQMISTFLSFLLCIFLGPACHSSTRCSSVSINSCSRDVRVRIGDRKSWLWRKYDQRRRWLVCDRISMFLWRHVPQLPLLICTSVRFDGGSSA